MAVSSHLNRAQEYVGSRLESCIMGFYRGEVLAIPGKSFLFDAVLLGCTLPRMAQTAAVLRAGLGCILSGNSIPGTRYLIIRAAR